MNEPTDLESITRQQERLKALWASAEEASAGSAQLLADLREIRAWHEVLVDRCRVLREVVDASSDFAFAKHDDGRYAMINPKGAQLFGMPPEVILDSNDRAIFPPPVAEMIMAGDREGMLDGLPRTREIHCELQGTPVTLAVTTWAWHHADGSIRGVVGVGREVGESADWRARARVQAAELLTREEGLRRSLASELHGDMCQELALARLMLARLRGADGSGSGPFLHDIEEKLERIDRSLRSITFRLSPSSLHDLGLVAALQGLAEDLARTRGLQVTIRDQGLPAIHDDRLRFVLFRSVRELLGSVLAPPGEGAVTVTLFGDDEWLRIAVENAGPGFDLVTTGLQGYALFGIREQLAHLGGCVKLNFRADGSTEVSLIAPAARPTDDGAPEQDAPDHPELPGFPAPNGR